MITLIVICLFVAVCICKTKFDFVLLVADAYVYRKENTVVEAELSANKKFII